MKRAAPINVQDALPAHVKHFRNTSLFESLEEVLNEFVGERILPAEAAQLLVETAAQALEQEFEKPPLSLSALALGSGGGIENYRFNAGYWQMVLRGPIEARFERGSFTASVPLLGLEGSGGGLAKGRGSAQGLKTAHTRQQAQDEKQAVVVEEDSWSD